ncbi:bifunctional diguanylate cyclase/phosphodiesterase [Arthrobacter cryoconiti]|uniref:bifunctional diguanylate cyclase/phosphodiesterase n=1 Tax=Arthrobacter cryoconiti TaxID=748907 RepID=UPI001E2AD674|nr:EAL domain-containing protein [Arthrobacter cryoconiti]
MKKRISAQDPRLSHLIEGIIELAKGNLDTRISASAARDDIDAVITGFNLMAETLGAANADLERRVKTRTALLEHANLKMERMSLTDPLTDLFNRRALVKALDDEIAKTTTADGAPTVLVLDLDSFKGVNDSLGHNAGDLVLKIVAQRILRTVRDVDVVARLGGDEFAVLLPATTVTQAKAIATRIVDSLDQSVTVDDNTFNFGASVGIAIAEPDDSAEYVLIKADTAMYDAKRDATKNVTLFDPILLYARQMRTKLVSELRTAIDAGQLALYYQPVVDMATGRIKGVEALVRWNHPTRGLVMPDEFIPLAEESGAIVDLGRWVLRTGVAQLHSWAKSVQLSADFTLRVNISVTELQRLEFVDEVRDVLSNWSVSPSQLVLELTESTLVTGTESERYSLLGLRQLGVGLDIDDFGTGYSSLNYLRNLPVDVVKVDRSLIGNVVEDASQRRFVAAILELIQSCGMDVVFEGVETKEQAQVLRSLGCSTGQGFFFARPAPPAQLESILRAAAEGSFLPIGVSF